MFGVPAILLGITDTATQKTAEALMAEWLASRPRLCHQSYRAGVRQVHRAGTVPEGREWTEFDTGVLLRSMFRERIEG